ncbi:endonuclease domain-containing 1 protein-like [Chanos chanos]|uniref:Endonuclease domain-containing 1 protein-like n=1 Tax=Chanos chanos TaxID=29144 RepID=A0A6J2V304_CHACN|nr:endonuclease domain-containing 1 protein-like [Chanos chanos]
MTYQRCISVTLLVVGAWCGFSSGDVGDFSPCLKFFYQGWPPKGIAGTPICQRYENQYRFATLYGRSRRSPWFSAYVFSRPEGKRPRGHWKYEPQLAYPTAGGNMAYFPKSKLDPNVAESQAVPQDYSNSSYTRGHLNPSLHHQDRTDRKATFTLTNVAPQREGSNDGPWATFESQVNKTLSEYCKGVAYVVTGVIPYLKERWIKQRRVAIPEYYWSAYCCPSYSQSLPESLSKRFPTLAAIGRNDPNSTEEIVPVDRSKKKPFLGYDVRPMSLQTLEMYLTKRYGTNFSVFYEQCSGS